MKSGGKTVAITGKVTVADGKWHHLLAEVDRKIGKVTLYLDGKDIAAPAEPLPAGASLKNAGDFIVGQGFHGSLDYLRICRGTLADAQTTIDELMSWEFNGPASHDFSGKPAAGERRDVGAIEHPTASGQKKINYSPPAPLPKEEKKTVAAAAGNFLEGPDRLVKQQGWGSVSIPKTAKPGDKITVQVAFATETIPKDMRMRIDFHGMINGKRKPGIGQAAPIPVKPGVTSPYSADFIIPQTPGLSHVIAVIYASPTGGFTDKILATEASVNMEK